MASTCRVGVESQLTRSPRGLAGSFLRRPSSGARFAFSLNPFSSRLVSHGRVIAGRDLWTRPSNTQLHVFTLRRPDGHFVHGEALAFVIDDSEAFLACEEFLVTSMAARILRRVSSSTSALRGEIVSLVQYLEKEFHFTKEVLGRRPSVLKLDGPLFPSVLFPLNNATYVTVVVDRL